MDCVVCKAVETDADSMICEVCRKRLSAHFTDPVFMERLVDGIRRGRRSFLLVAQGVVQIDQAREELAAFYFSRPVSQRQNFLHRYNCRTAHPELHDILGQVSVRELGHWRSK